MKNKILQLTTAAILSSIAAYGAEITVNSNITSNTTWSADNTYILDAQVFVTNNATLTIEAGTRIYATDVDPAASLIITRGAKIMAEGTADAPIIFTTILAQDPEVTLTSEDTELWGGILVLGNARINSRADNLTNFTDPITDQIEGFTGEGLSELITFGGNNDADNSGVMRYISIRHGGSVVGGDNEINGFTFGGVGSGTVVEYLESFANKDDSIEFFGGTVSVKYFVSAYGYDDSVDYDQGWRGNMQFVLSVSRQGTFDAGDKAGEHDGATAPLDSTPLGGGIIANATYIGHGTNVALNVRDNAGVEYYNSVFTNFGKLLFFETDNQDAIDAGRVKFDGNIWFSAVEANNTLLGIQNTTAGLDISDILTAGRNDIVNPGLANIVGESGTTAEPVPTGTFDPRPASMSSPAAYGAVAVPTTASAYVDGPVAVSDFFEQTYYRGAFEPGKPLWIAGWTALDEYGYLADTSAPSDSLVALSSRLTVNAGAEVNVGLIITEPTTVVILAKSIAGAPNSLENPEISVRRFANGNFDTVVASNDDFDAEVSFPEAIAPAAATDAGLILTLQPGAYAAIVSGTTATDEGEVLVEAYDLNYANSL